MVSVVDFVSQGTILCDSILLDKLAWKMLDENKTMTGQVVKEIMSTYWDSINETGNREED